MDDGNRQLAISLGLNPEQFEALDTKLGGIDGAVNKLAENVSSPDTDLATEISKLRTEVVAQLTASNESSVTLAQAITLASENLGKWLAAIALAAANPNDNSAEIQRQIDEVTAQLNTSTAELKGEIDQQTKEK
jgi:hypothetical protein